MRVVDIGERRITTMAAELIGYNLEDMTLALNAMEDSLSTGEQARLKLCTNSLPSEGEIESIYNNLIANGFHVNYPSAYLDGEIAVTDLVLTKGSPQWAALIPLIVPILIIGLIAFSIVKIESIAAALVKIIAVAGGIAITILIILRAPSRKELARIREIERSREKAALVPATSKKEGKLWYLGEHWEKEYSSAEADVYRSADGKKRLNVYWDGSKQVVPVEASTSKKALAASLR
jgi:hypothetical protein